MSEPLTEVGQTSRGYRIYREPNGAGGHRYWSDAIGGGVIIWDTSLASRDEIETAFRIEEGIAAEQHAACRSMGTGQCAAICLSHMSSHEPRKCPEAGVVWTQDAIKRERKRRPDGPLMQAARR